MEKSIQIRHAQTLRAMHDRRHLLLLPNAWDAGSARLFAARGFKAVATTSGGMAWALGHKDGEQAPLADTLVVVRHMARVLDVPLTVDFEGGYGATSEQVGESVRAVIDAGAAGINLEDGTAGHGPLRPLDDAAERIAAARAAATAAGVPLVINARVDNWMHPQADPADPLGDAVARGRAYLAAGADCLYPIGLSDPATLKAFIDAVDAPVNAMARANAPSLDALAQLGVARVSTGTWLSALALGAADKAVRSMLETGGFAGLATDFGYRDAQALFAD
ncbi:MAG TPA: isocitrate lyase/phosphoenolpyruvate mutase family protein [Rhodanobacteraceae bacterium]